MPLLRVTLASQTVASTWKCWTQCASYFESVDSATRTESNFVAAYASVTITCTCDCTPPSSNKVSYLKKVYSETKLSYPVSAAVRLMYSHRHSYLPAIQISIGRKRIMKKQQEVNTRLTLILIHYVSAT